MKEFIYNIQEYAGYFTIGYVLSVLHSNIFKKTKFKFEIILIVFWLITTIYYSELFIQSNL